MLETTELKIVPTVFPPALWVRTMQVDTVVGSTARA